MDSVPSSSMVNPPKIVDQRPVWKPIGEASDSFDSMERVEDELRRNEAKVRQEASRIYPIDRSPFNVNPFW